MVVYFYLNIYEINENEISGVNCDLYVFVSNWRSRTDYKPYNNYRKIRNPFELYRVDVC